MRRTEIPECARKRAEMEVRSFDVYDEHWNLNDPVQPCPLVRLQVLVAGYILRTTSKHPRTASRHGVMMETECRSHFASHAYTALSPFIPPVLVGKL